jgi:adenylate cyclase
MGDGLLIEFPSVVEAVRNAVEVQDIIREHNINVPDDRRVEFRVGINVGDIIVDGGDIYGDGVNIAARLEELAEPGGICLSDDSYNQIRDKLDFEFEELGERNLKNIDRPIHIWKWLSGSTESASTASIAAPAPAEPEKVSIAVLPFDNMSGDPEQEYFSDGITEDLITDLSKISELFVVARNATFTYKGKAVMPQQVANDLGVRHILEGSVRKAGVRLRISAQLIDASTGGHVWAERYDRELTDIFALQDEITEKIVSALKVKLTKGEERQVANRYTQNLEA